MLFNSAVFAIFVIPYWVLHLSFGPSLRLMLVIVGSTIFYAYWKPAYVYLPIVLTVVAQAGAWWVKNTSEQAARKVRTAVVVTVLFIPLLVYKYMNFIVGTIAPHYLAQHGKLIHLSLPLGISFVTFTLVAYVVDVSRRKYPFEKNFLLLFGSVLFFPHLIAGPIVRPSQLIPQMRTMGRASLSRVRLGLFLFVIGLFKKMVISDPIGGLVDQVYSGLSHHQSAWLHLFAFYGFSFQIFCDFSGYTDMALGLAHTLGVRLPQNFWSPYSASSLPDFWERWHISLSRWLRDYLYIPLGGNRSGKSAQIRNIFITMALGGLWHGANWTFLWWGLIHAVGIGFCHLVRGGAFTKVPTWLKTFFTFNFVTLAWVFFRAPSVQDAVLLLSGMFKQDWTVPPSALMAFPTACLIIAALVHRWDRHSFHRFVQRRFSNVAYALLLLLLFCACIAVSSGSSQQFIYFEF